MNLVSVLELRPFQNPPFPKTWLKCSLLEQDVDLEHELRCALHEALEEPQQRGVRVLVDHEGVVAQALPPRVLAGLKVVGARHALLPREPAAHDPVAHRVDVPEDGSDLREGRQSKFEQGKVWT